MKEQKTMKPQSPMTIRRNTVSLGEARERATVDFQPRDKYYSVAREFHHCLLLGCIEYLDEKTLSELIDKAFGLMRSMREDDKGAASASVSTAPSKPTEPTVTKEKD